MRGIVCLISCAHLDASHLDEYPDFTSLVPELPLCTLRIPATSFG